MIGLHLKGVLWNTATNRYYQILVVTVETGRGKVCSVTATGSLTCFRGQLILPLTISGKSTVTEIIREVL